ncbi:MAG: YggS family pyridoxal phosphate-dependent enzyme [Acidobacteria bacterium]|nr:MAG: YggS family pyridoxal phosphate-dependent enzyme [Acidobacteriota bacterium]
MVEKAPQPGDLRQRLDTVREKIAECARRSGRSADELTLIAVSKTHPAELIREAIAAGMADFGENRVPEAEGKIPEVGRDKARWHLIGHLQSNKARRAVELFDVIHSLDSKALASRLDRICLDLDRQELPVLIQVDLGLEPTKTGAVEKDLPEIIEAVKASERLSLIGLMTLPPFFNDAEKARPFFRRLREMRDEIRKQGAFGDGCGELSMGMPHYYEVAIEESATMLRIGTAIFGERASREP